MKRKKRIKAREHFYSWKFVDGMEIEKILFKYKIIEYENIFKIFSFYQFALKYALS